MGSSIQHDLASRKHTFCCWLKLIFLSLSVVLGVNWMEYIPVNQCNCKYYDLLCRFNITTKMSLMIYNGNFFSGYILKNSLLFCVVLSTYWCVGMLIISNRRGCWWGRIQIQDFWRERWARQKNRLDAGRRSTCSGRVVQIQRENGKFRCRRKCMMGLKTPVIGLTDGTNPRERHGRKRSTCLRTAQKDKRICCLWYSSYCRIKIKIYNSNKETPV